MLMHFGTDDRRTDKFYNGYLDKMIKTLKRKGPTLLYRSARLSVYSIL